jgi:hypothetical protein
MTFTTATASTGKRTACPRSRAICRPVGRAVAPGVRARHPQCGMRTASCGTGAAGTMGGCRRDRGGRPDEETVRARVGMGKKRKRISGFFRLARAWGSDQSALPPNPMTRARIWLRKLRKWRRYHRASSCQNGHNAPARHTPHHQTPRETPPFRAGRKEVCPARATVF